VRNKILLSLALLYTIALAIISLLKATDLPDVDIDNGDKYAHTIAYALLCLFWYIALKANSINAALVKAVTISIIYGIILEVLQGTLTEARVTDLYDILANCIGVVFISLIIALRNKTHVKKI
jgi:VanZ family protein